MQADSEDYEEILSPARGDHYYQVLKMMNCMVFLPFPVDKDKQELSLGYEARVLWQRSRQRFLQTILRFIEENLSAKS